MSPSHLPETTNPPPHKRYQDPQKSKWIGRNGRVGALLAGGLALLWLLLRTGSKPSRLTYPCQQAALSTASLTFGAALTLVLLAIRRQALAWLRRPAGVAVLIFVFLGTAGIGGYYAAQADPAPPRLAPPPDYRARVYTVADCPRDPQGTHFVGLEMLLRLMGRDGLKFYRSATPSLTSGPAGLIAADDVVLIKINYQWDQRGGTNTDLLRGLLQCLLDHPDAFTGDVVVCENAQFASTQNFNRSQNNAQDPGLSPQDVISGFRQQGFRVSLYDWTNVRFNSVSEYSQGDMNDGYIVLAYDPQVQGRVSYPKFRSADGRYISLKHGVWDPQHGTYDQAHLKFINLPVLKSHSIYGITACMKDYMGVVTRELSTNSHAGIRYGILGAHLAETRLADLNILDCLWINAIPNNGPSTSYGVATRRDTLLASTDPIAADMWAALNILTPAFIANGYPRPWPTADPLDPGSAFRTYLDNSMSRLLAANHQVTNDPAMIDALAVVHGDLNCDGFVDNEDVDPFVLALLSPSRYAAAWPECDRLRADCNHDGFVDNEDVDPFVALLTHR